MTPYGYIYITTNTTNGKKYIGQNSYSSKSTERYLGSGKYLKLAIKKYGRLCFEKEVLFVSFSLDDLNWAEKHFIAEAQAVTSKDFYNCSPGGKSSLGFIGKTQTAEFKLAMSERFKGKQRDDKARESMKEAWVRKKKNGYIQTPNPNQSAISKIVGLANRGRTHSKKECPHCSRLIGPGPYAKFHGENCKLRADGPL